ncbi:MAG: hypothetical protein M0C28_34650 [Candidatus Moduliflexus flocculans]|nr:hypothetical protein [Candidatus Moduliflexus flocculans]
MSGGGGSPCEQHGRGVVRDGGRVSGRSAEDAPGDPHHLRRGRGAWSRQPARPRRSSA